MATTALLSQVAQQPQWVINNSLVDYVNNTTTPLPTSNSPNHTQNGLINHAGQLEFYAEDGAVRDGAGNLIVQQVNVAGLGYNAPGHSEFVFVPVPETCDEYFCISTFVKTGMPTNFAIENYLIYSRIKNVNGSWIAQTMPNGTLVEHWKNEGCLSFSRSDSMPNGEEVNYYDYHNHLAVTRANLSGNRYLFMSIPECIGVFEIRNSDIIYLNSSTSNGTFLQNNRSEMEVFEYEAVGGLEKYTLVTSYYSNPDLDVVSQNKNKGGAIHLFEVSISSGSSVTFSSNYQVIVPKSSRLIDYMQCVNGIEFSTDGLTLYASHLSIFDGGSSGLAQSSDNILVYFQRSSLNSTFSYFGPIVSGDPNKDFAYGQLERGKDGKLYVAGNNRLGALADINDPASAWTSNAVQLNNQLTSGQPYLLGFPDDYYELLYLLPDQIDGEDYSRWSFGPPNEFLQNPIYTCDYPHVLNLSRSFYYQVNQLAAPFTQSSGNSNTITLTQGSQVVISYFSDLKCAETLIVKCCAEPGTEILCPIPFTVTKTFDYVLKTVEICASTCITDIPAPCEIYWSFSWPIDRGHRASGNYTGHSFCQTIPLLNLPASHQHSVIHLHKVLCQGEECGPNEEVILDEPIDLYVP